MLLNEHRLGTRCTYLETITKVFLEAGSALAEHSDGEKPGFARMPCCLTQLAHTIFGRRGIFRFYLAFAMRRLADTVARSRESR